MPFNVLSHTHECEWSAWEWELMPTCQTVGRQVRVCLRPDCGLHDRRTVACVPHEYNAATCTEPSSCRFGCGTTQGAALGHDYAAATCVSPMSCTRCGATTGELGEHSFSPASCKNPSTCSVCGYTTGEPLAHDYTPPTCRRRATCTVCGATTGDLLPHEYVNGRCIMCLQHEIFINEIPDETE